MRTNKIAFITGTRADYGKLKTIMMEVEKNKNFELHIFVTGMHINKMYGETINEVIKDGYKNIHRYNNEQNGIEMIDTYNSTINGFKDFLKKVDPDIVVVHGDRVEAIAAASTSAIMNYRVAHIEGGEITGTIDESIRHAISKFSHIHFTSNEDSKKVLIQLGEEEKMIHVIGSPDIDVMLKNNLPSIEEVKERYGIEFDDFAISILHPVTTEIKKMKQNSKEYFKMLKESNKNYIIIYPNNDLGSEHIINEINSLPKDRFKVIRSMRFEYFLTTLKETQFIIGNSSAGIREAGVYGIKCINVGSRQNGRFTNKMKYIITTEFSSEILDAIKHNVNLKPDYHFGNGKSTEGICKVLFDKETYTQDLQKKMVIN